MREALEPLLSKRPLALILIGSGRTSETNRAPPPDEDVLGPATTALCQSASGNWASTEITTQVMRRM